MGTNIRIPKKRGLLLLVVCLAAIPALQLAGCTGPGYYAQAISGHMGLMISRQSVEALLANSSTDPELAKNLEQAMALREFATAALALPNDGSYTDFVETGRDAVVWNVVAAPEFSLEAKKWCFLVSGCVSYRGYFERDKADKFANRLQARGYDVSVSPAIAYSTLGWFDDPLLDTMFRYTDVQLAAFVFHELAHRKLYVSGDTAFNEAYATAVELVGVRLWLEGIQQTDALARWLATQTAAGDFAHLIQQAREALRAVYASGAKLEAMRMQKSHVLERLESDYRVLVGEQWGDHDYFAGWFGRPLNNASLSLMSSYQGGECAFSELWSQSDHDPARFHALARTQAGLPAPDRKKWLESSCESIASRGKL